MVLEAIKEALGPNQYKCRCHRVFEKTPEALERDRIVHFIPVDHPLCDDCVIEVVEQRKRKLENARRQYEQQRIAAIHKRIRATMRSL